MTDYSSEQIEKLRFIRSENVGPATYWSLLKRFGSASRALEAIPDIARKGGLKRVIKICAPDTAEKEIARIEKFGARLLFADDPLYPGLLGQIHSRPPILTIAGQTGLLQKRKVAIVGSRRASAAGTRLARDFAHDLGLNNIVVVSGMALGIDGAAHQGALDTGTIAVLGGGIDHIYPPDHNHLYQDIRERGLLVSEAPFGTVAQARHFPQRNRIVSGMSGAVIVVEANQKSGSLITAKYALEQDRDIYAVPGSPLDPRAKGTNALIKQGAYLLESIDDIISQHMPPPHIDDDKEGWPGKSPTTMEDVDMDIDDADLDSARDGFIALLSPTPLPVDDLIQETGLPPAIVQCLLVELELAGRLERHPGNAVSLLTDNDDNHGH